MTNALIQTQAQHKNMIVVLYISKTMSTWWSWFIVANVLQNVNMRFVWPCKGEKKNQSMKGVYFQNNVISKSHFYDEM